MTATNSAQAVPAINRTRTSTKAPGIETEMLSWQLGQAATSQTLPDLVNHLSRIIHEQTDCLALWFSIPDESGAFTSFRPVPARQDDPVWHVVEDLTRSITPKSVETGLQQFTEFQSDAQLVVSPIGKPRGDQTFQANGVWVACFSTESQTAVRQNWLMGMIAQATSAWFENRNSMTLESRANHANDILTTFVSLSNTDRVQQTCTVLCNQLRKQLSVEMVAVALKEGSDSFRVTAISDVEQIDPAAGITREISAACEASGTTGTQVVYPSPDSEVVDDEALMEFCKNQNVEACVSLPLSRSDGSVFASLLLVTTRERTQDPASVENFLKMSQLLGTHVDLVSRANRGPRQWLSQKIEQIKSSNWNRNAIIAFTALFIIMCLPLPYRIPCDCTIQPVKRRFLAAPYDGILDRADVKLGDLVSKGDTLAHMDAGNLKIELLGLQAELAAARKRRDAALAQSEVAQSQIARSEMKRHQAQIDLLNERLKNLEIRSPIDGLVVAGDLEKAQGAPLEMGQTVFEVAPLDRMLVEVAIEQSEIGYTRPGMAVDIKLNAFPFRSWEGTVKNICPSTEIVNDKAVFVAEVEIANDELKLKPGMEGTAKIRGDRACLAWSLFHRPWESIRYWTVW